MTMGLIVRFRQWMRQNPGKIAIIGIWLVMLAALRWTMTAEGLTFAEALAAGRDLLAAAWIGPIVYVMIYMVRPVLLFPASLLTILAGQIYGLQLGFVYGLLAGTLSAIVPYAAGVWIARKPQQHAADEVLTAVNDWRLRLPRERPFVVVLTMRLLYLPYDTVSFAVGVLGIRFGAFFAATAIGNIAGTLAFVGIGASLKGELGDAGASLDPAMLLLSVVLFVLSLGASQMLRQRYATPKTTPSED